VSSIKQIHVCISIDIIRRHGLETCNKIFRLFSLWCASCYNVDRLFTGLFFWLFSSVDILFYIVSVLRYVLNKNTGVFADIRGNNIGERCGQVDSGR